MKRWIRHLVGTHSSDQDLSRHSPQDTPVLQSRQTIQRHIGAIGGILALLSGIGAFGLSKGRCYVRQVLLPQINQDLSHSLSRPVNLGEVKQISLSHIRLGASSIPATATDADTVTMEGIDVRFNLWKALRTQEVELDVTLIKPKIFLDQSPTGEWLETDLQLQDDEAITVRHIRMRDGDIVLAPDLDGWNGEGVLHQKAVVDLPQTFTFDRVHTHISLDENSGQLDFRASGQSDIEGRFSLKGSLSLPSNTAPNSSSAQVPDNSEDMVLDMSLTTKQLSTLPLNLVLPPSVRIIDGTLSSKLHVVRSPQVGPTIDGTVTLQNLGAWVKGEPNPFHQTNGQFHINNQEILLTDGFTRYGHIPFDVQGRIHLEEGLDLDAQVVSVSVPDFMDTFNFTLPFAADGALTTDNLRVTGPLDYAVFSGTVSNAIPVQMDRLTLEQVQTDFKFDTKRDRLQLIDTTVIPTLGGSIEVDADIHLDDGDNDEVDLTVQADDLPADAIATLYDLGLPADTLGDFQGTATVAVKNQQPQITMQWQGDGGHYPSQGTVTLENERVQLKDAAVYVADHPIAITGMLENEQWQMQVDAEAMPLEQLLTSLPDENPLADNSSLQKTFTNGALDGQLLLSGPVDAIALSTLTAQGNAQIHTDMGQLDVEADMTEGNWQTHLRSQNVAIISLLDLVPQMNTTNELMPSRSGRLSGDLHLSGSMDHFHPTAIAATGQVNLTGLTSSDQPSLLPPSLDVAFQWQGDRLQLNQASTESAALSGWIDVNWHTVPQLGDMEFSLLLDDYNVAPVFTAISSERPSGFDLAGYTSFDGNITGTPTAPKVQGDFQLEALKLNQIALPSTLTGTIQSIASQGTQVQLTGMI